MSEEYEKIKKQQLNNYISAVKEIIKNNTTALIEDDINSLIVKPPLDSMDIIKNKYLDLAKKYKITVNTKVVEEKLEKYRKNIMKDIGEIKEIRINSLYDGIDKFVPKKEKDTIKVTKSELNNINKKINKRIKEILKSNIEKYLIVDIESFFVKFDSDIQKQKTIKDLERFFSKTYPKQIIESINFKIIVKDTTLINGVKEQKERYLFTILNSRINSLN